MQVREIINLKGGTLFTATPKQLLGEAIDDGRHADFPRNSAGAQGP